LSRPLARCPSLGGIDPGSEAAQATLDGESRAAHLGHRAATAEGKGNVEHA
jgi:hypothetical protein